MRRFLSPFKRVRGQIPAARPVVLRSPAQKRLTLLGAMLVAGIAAADLQTIAVERTEAIADYRTATANLANGMSAQTSHMLLKLGAALTGLQANLTKTAGQLQETLHSQSATNLLAARLMRLTGVNALFILDAGGRIAATAGDLAATGDWARDDLVRRLRDDAHAPMVIGTPFQDTSSGKWVSFLAHRIDDGHVAFAGAVVAELSLADLEDFYRYAMPRQRRLTLFGEDGVVMVRYPPQPGVIGRKAPAGAAWYAAATSGGSYLAPDAFDALPVLGVVRPVPGTPLLIEAAIAETDVIAGWQEQRPRLMLCGILACGGVILLLRLFAAQIRRLAERNAQVDEARGQLHVAISNVSQGICFFDGQQRLLLCNQRFADIYKLPLVAVRQGIAFEDLVGHWYKACGPAGTTRSEFLESHAAITRSGAPNHTVVELTDGRTVAVHQQPMPDGGWVGTHEDITERRKSEERIAFMARHDVLTGLPNRSMLIERIDVARAAAGRGQAFAILFLDLDRFKAVNDTLGHAAGDALLQEVAERLRDIVREGDTVARLGGDEFVVLQAAVASPQAALTLAERIIATVGAPYMIAGNDVIIGVSIGIDIATGNAISAEDLLKNADMALYMSKAEGRGTFRFFKPEMDAKTQNRHALERDLRCALERGEFVLHYQAIVDARARRTRGFEALLRWQHPQRGLVGPLDFMPVAEESGLILPIGEWVMRQACRDAATWPDHIHVAVNLSTIQFRSAGLSASVRNALADAALPAERLELEITESVLLQNNERNMAIMHGFRDFGIGIVMDDFGVGCASLSYLLQFPFQCIKIDRCFVDQVATDRNAAAVVHAILGLCRELDIKTIAEGVENTNQLAALLRMGCTDMQGYLFSRPKPASRLADLFNVDCLDAGISEAANTA